MSTFSTFAVRLPSRIRRIKPATALAIAAIVGALAVNELTVARYLASDGILESATVHSIRWLQIALSITALSLLLSRPTLLVCLIVGLSILNITIFQKQAAIALEETKEPVNSPLRELRKALPAVVRVGYVSDEVLWTSSHSQERYYLTQYALAPVIVEVGAKTEWVIGNYGKFESNSIPEDLILVRNFGSGIILFHKK